MNREKYILKLIKDIKETNYTMIPFLLERKGYICESWGLNQVHKCGRTDNYLIDGNNVLTILKYKKELNTINKFYVTLEVDGQIFHL